MLLATLSVLAWDDRRAHQGAAGPPWVGTGLAVLAGALIVSAIMRNPCSR